MTALVVRPLVDPLVDPHPLGMSPLSLEAETFYAPRLGPSSLLLARRLVMFLRPSRPEALVPLDQLGPMVGLGTGVRQHSLLNRTLIRLEGFDLIRREDPAGLVLLVRTRWAPLTERQVNRLPAILQPAWRAYAREREQLGVAS